MLRVNNLTVEYSSILFQNVSFKLGNKEKVGLVGLNGTGKTTLLRILKKIDLPDKGEVEIANEHIEYLPQEYSFPDGQLIGEILESLVDNPKSEMYKVNKILRKLGLTDLDIFQEVNILSEGQKMKLYLTTLLIKNPTILLLDEPTNHLDIYGIKWLEKFIKEFDGICIIISHDRAFLNNVIDKVFEIDEKTLNIFEGNYDDYLIQKAQLIEEKHKHYHLQEKHREKLITLIERVNSYSAGEKQSRALSAAKHRLIREVLDKEINEYKDQTLKDIKIAGNAYNSKQIVKIKDLSFSYDNKKVINNSSFSMFGKEKVWFFGANGIGKTTLIKLIIDELKASGGEIKIGENLKWAYFSQSQSHLNMEETVEDYFLRGTRLSYNQSFGVMERFLFPKDLRKVKIKRLSPGQRARLSFAIFSLKEYDFMILDEPTNHIDIKSKEVIEEALRSYQGSILLVSHDRYFVKNVEVNRAITLDQGKIVEIKDLELHFGRLIH